MLYNTNIDDSNLLQNSENTPEGRRITKLDQILLNGNNITMVWTNLRPNFTSFGRGGGSFWIHKFLVDVQWLLKFYPGPEHKYSILIACPRWTIKNPNPIPNLEEINILIYRIKKIMFQTKLFEKHILINLNCGTYPWITWEKLRFCKREVIESVPDKKGIETGTWQWYTSICLEVHVNIKHFCYFLISSMFKMMLPCRKLEF